MRVEKGRVNGHVELDGWECSFTVNGATARNITIIGEYKGEYKEYHSFYNIEHLKDFPKNVLDAIHAEVKRCEELSHQKYRELEAKGMNDYKTDILPKFQALIDALGDRWEYVSGDEFAPYVIDHETGVEIVVDL